MGADPPAADSDAPAGHNHSSAGDLLPLTDATWPEVDRAARKLLLLPLGSIEQHGPHLPLNTDTLIATRLADHVHSRLPLAGLAPPMPYGASGEHQDFPGTLSIGTEALTAFLVEFVRHASRTWRNILVINGHGGNARALKLAAELMQAEGRSMTVVHAASGGPRVDAHAGYRETSLMLHLQPDTVRLDLLTPGNVAPLAELAAQLRMDGVRAVSENGILGDPTGANAAEGERIFTVMTAAAMDTARRLMTD